MAVNKRAPRYCEWCGKKIPRRRPNKRYCDATCRAEHGHARRGTPGRPDKPLQSVAEQRKRAIRDGSGTRMYVVRDDVVALADVLAGREPAPEARERLAAKVPAALERIERKAA